MMNNPLNHFNYFAYGSNMLTARLAARCPSARALGPAIARGFTFAFAKTGADGSGKATLVAARNAALHGVIFRIDRSDLPALDRAEGGYRRIDDFPIEADGGARSAVTYIAEAPTDGLLPFDWYHALVVAGAREHELPKAYVDWLATQDNTADQRKVCEARARAFAALKSAGYETVNSALYG